MVVDKAKNERKKETGCGRTSKIELASMRNRKRSESSSVCNRRRSQWIFMNILILIKMDKLILIS
jgi:hypothetical protein